MRLTEPEQDFEMQFCRESGCDYYGEPNGCNHPDDACLSSAYFTEVAEKLRDYEDLEEAGRLVKLPCKVGDTVYYYNPRDIRDKIIPMTIVDIKILSSGELELAHVNEYGERVYITDGYFGKTVFLAREKAEAALKGAENGGIN